MYRCQICNEEMYEMGDNYYQCFYCGYKFIDYEIDRREDNGIMT